MTVERAVAAHYGHGRLAEAVFAALRQAGRDVDRLGLDDLAPIDEFHSRGREATVDLGRLLALTPEQHVLDLGCGIGGASRYFAATHGCRITGIDLSAEYCALAADLARRLGMGERLAYRAASALALPFADGAFDAAYTQHVAMNIAEKPQLYAEVARVLKPGARFAIYDLLQGSGGPVHFPVPWASDQTASFLATPDELRGLLTAAGFTIASWQERSSESLAWYARAARRLQAQPPPFLTLELLLGPRFREMSENLGRNLAESRVIPTEILCRKAE